TAFRTSCSRPWSAHTTTPRASALTSRPRPKPSAKCCTSSVNPPSRFRGNERSTFFMSAVILQAINGISLAALLFLLASGFTLTFGLMRVVNMAHGAYYLLGGLICLPTPRHTGSFALGVIGGELAIIHLGFLIDRFLIRRTGENNL